MNVAYFPGCSLHGLSRAYNSSTHLVCDKLNINLQEIEDWNCCGATAAHSLNHKLSVSLGARNLNIAKNMNLDMITVPCAGCFGRLKTASYELRNNPELAKEVAEIINAPAPVEPEVTNLVQFFTEQVGLEKIASKVVKPLTGLKVAAYYGCLLTRPSKVVAFDSPEQPTSMDDILQVIGIETVNWSHKAECCGGGYAASETDIVVDLSGQVVESAKNAGADAIVVACPMCHTNLDTRLGAIEKSRGVKYDMPIIFFTQLMGLAYGYSYRQLGFRQLLNSASPLLKKQGII
ncbi:MAG: heterodisulfide reductase subunit B [Syntrophomonadaceae bacterium]|nr:heterodisulfide reductase subunit B [Syntrophomonadaceae bacterium]